MAREREAGFVLESPTWRANPGWAEKIGYSEEKLEEANRKAIALMQELRLEEDDAGNGPDRDQRLHRPARRRLQPGDDAERRGGARLPLDADRDLRRHRRRHGHGDHDDLRRGGARRRAGGARGGPAGRPLVHGRDRRPAAERAAARRRDRAGRRGDGLLPRLLHDQLRPPDPLRARDLGRRVLAGADPRRAGERLDDEPRGAGRGRRARRGRSRRPRRPPRQASRPAPER